MRVIIPCVFNLFNKSINILYIHIQNGHFKYYNFNLEQIT